jgi:hypothetical protein
MTRGTRSRLGRPADNCHSGVGVLAADAASVWLHLAPGALGSYKGCETYPNPC